MIVAPMTVDTRDTLMRMAAFEQVRRLGSSIHGSPSDWSGQAG
jgi:hypothetical protein